MSTIRLVPEVMEHLHKSQGASAQGSVFEGQPRPLRTNQELVHAWSIGVTGTARELREKPQPADRQSHETCPPEVYIG